MLNVLLDLELKSERCKMSFAKIETQLNRFLITGKGRIIAFQQNPYASLQCKIYKHTKVAG